MVEKDRERRVVAREERSEPDFGGPAIQETARKC